MDKISPKKLDIFKKSWHKNCNTTRSEKMDNEGKKGTLPFFPHGAINGTATYHEARHISITENLSKTP